MSDRLDLSPLDLSPLDPSTDRERWEALIARITDRARPELARRSAQTGVLGTLGNWAWPALAAAALAAILSGAALVLTRVGVETADSEIGIVHALGVSEPVAIWLDTDRAPTASDLIQVLEEND